MQVTTTSLGLFCHAGPMAPASSVAHSDQNGPELWCPSTPTWPQVAVQIPGITTAIDRNRSLRHQLKKLASDGPRSPGETNHR